MAEPQRTPEAPGHSYLFLDPALSRGGLIVENRLATFSERHKIDLVPPELLPIDDPMRELARQEAEGVICSLEQGWAGRGHLKLARQALRANRSVFFYWPAESAIEALDQNSCRTHQRIWLAAKLFFGALEPLARKGRSARQSLHHTARRAGMVLRHPRRAVRAFSQALRASFLHDPSAEQAPAPAAPPAEPNAELASADEALKEVLELIDGAAPAELQPLPRPGADDLIDGTGVYLRTDFWAPISSGGSYGHTCYVAKELAASCRDFVCFMANRYSLLDELGVHQTVLAKRSEFSDEEVIAGATRHYRSLLEPALQALRPKFIYERLCLGNYVGALLSRELQIPYIVEYNGSEISMRRSFGSSSYKYEELYLKAEEAAFAQATMISVVSEPIREELVRRGVAADKILVNPNGADYEVYAPVEETDRARLRSKLGFRDSDKVIGFTGTFGGWHGIDLLAEALPRICQEDKHARFLLIGDGNYKHLVDKQIEKHDLGALVVSTGRIKQKEGARLLPACDVFVSPHNRHMVDSRFFGSPTKIFEYMAVGAGIVASDLEQIGIVLSPAFRPSELNGGEVEVTNQRAVLCVPGDLDEFVRGVVGLLERRSLRETLGRNARQAVIDHYSWQRHVAKLWGVLRGELVDRGLSSFEQSGRPLGRVATGDAYKDQVQEQWDNDPCGSHYVEESQPDTLAWYQEAERYRFGEYAPWMPKVMEFDRHADERVLEIGGGMGTDLSQFASAGSRVFDVDLSRGHLDHARRNFALRGLEGGFVQSDAERLPFADGTFDIVYSNGVIHHTPGTRHVIGEMRRVLKPKGKAIVMVYAENSLHYWAQLVGKIGLVQGMLEEISIGEIMSRSVERSESGAKPLVKVYTKPTLKAMFADFEKVEIYKRQLTAAELPGVGRWLSPGLVSPFVGWNLIVKARRP